MTENEKRLAAEINESFRQDNFWQEVLRTRMSELIPPGWLIFGYIDGEGDFQTELARQLETGEAILVTGIK